MHFRFILSEIDKPFFIIIMVLLIFGLIMMFSASYAASMQDNASASTELKNVCKALYLYNQAAIAYFASIQ